MTDAWRNEDITLSMLTQLAGSSSPNAKALRSLVPHEEAEGFRSWPIPTLAVRA